MNNILLDVKPEHYFLFKDGAVVKNLDELYKTIEKISEDTFKHHVNEQKNDFHNWVRDVFEDKELADNLLKTRKKEELIGCIKSRIMRAENETGHKTIEELTDTLTTNLTDGVSSNTTDRVNKAEKQRYGMCGMIKKAREPLDKPYMVSCAAIALAILVMVVSVLNLHNKPKIVGAVISNAEYNEYSSFVIIGSIMIIGLVTLVMSRRNEKNKEIRIIKK